MPVNATYDKLPGDTRNQLLTGSKSSTVITQENALQYFIRSPRGAAHWVQQEQLAPGLNGHGALMDNLGYGELGIYGGGILRGAPTPTIDKLASEGMRLLNFNVEASRAVARFLDAREGPWRQCCDQAQ